MAEQIISPGVFTRENDLSFLPQGIGAIGAVIVGPTEKGPAFVPTVIMRGYSEYLARFGASSDLSPSYVPSYPMTLNGTNCSIIDALFVPTISSFDTLPTLMMYCHIDALFVMPSRNAWYEHFSTLT